MVNNNQKDSGLIMDSQQHIITMLEQRDIRPTAMRIMILREMLSCDEAFSLLSLEDRLDTVDKSTIYRCITLFLTHHLIHAIDDGTGTIKYAVCSPECHCGENGEHLDDLHAHFYCEQCHRTYCLNRIHVPVVTLPAGFQVKHINYVLKGICSACASHNSSD